MRRRDERIAPVELPGENSEHEQKFYDGREARRHHEARQGLDGVASALQDACEPAGLAAHMIAHRQAMHVVEDVDRKLLHRMHRDGGEERVARLRQQRIERAQQTI